jgi:CYTH domain-containing protein
MPRHSKYARIEWERRFLLDRFPYEASVIRVRRISDRYIEGTTLRLRQQSDGAGEIVFKLTQKLGEGAVGAQQGLITTMYLTKEEFCVLAKLPARVLTKTRHSVPPFGIDVFEGVLSGLVLAEAEISSAAEASALAVPSFVVHEVSDDLRFTGGRLVTASRQELEAWLAEHGVKLNPSQTMNSFLASDGQTVD